MEVWAICPIHFCPKYLSYIFICPILVVVEGSSGWRCGPFVLNIFVLYLSYIYLSYIYICPILVVVEGSSGWRCGPFVLILPPHTSPTLCGNISSKYQENSIFRHID